MLQRLAQAEIDLARDATTLAGHARNPQAHAVDGFCRVLVEAELTLAERAMHRAGDHVDERRRVDVERPVRRAAGREARRRPEIARVLLLRPPAWPLRLAHP